MAIAAQYLFNRVYSLTIAPAIGAAAGAYGNLSAAQAALRVSFDIDRDSRPTPNSAKLTVYNLSAQTRAAIGIGYVVTVRAGYDGLCDKLFEGAVHKVTHKKQGADVVTDIEAADGVQALLATRYRRVFPAHTSLATALADVAAAMDIDAGVAIGLPNASFARGVSLHGSCQAALHRLLDRYGLEFSVQNGKLNIIPYGHHLGTAAVVVAAQSGLLSLPSAPAKDAIAFDSLLNPKLVPGQLVLLQSPAAKVDGFFKLRKVKFAGDSHDEGWTASCEAVRLAQPLQKLTPAYGLAYGQAVVPGLS